MPARCVCTRRWPLHAAAANNRLSVARVLVERGADVDRLDAVSEPALWHAVEQGHGDMVALLLELGATASDLPCPPGKVRLGCQYTHTHTGAYTAVSTAVQLRSSGFLPVRAGGLCARGAGC